MLKRHLKQRLHSLYNSFIFNNLYCKHINCVAMGFLLEPTLFLVCYENAWLDNTSFSLNRDNIAGMWMMYF